MNTRREFVRLLVTGAVGTLAIEGRSSSHALGIDAHSTPEDPWAKLPQILKSIRTPSFSRREFPITEYGAVADGEADCTDAFKKAIAACSESGGGRVIVTAGSFLTGAIHLRSNVNLHLLAGATIKFTRDPNKYLPVVFTRWEGVELMNYSPFIYAFQQQNIGITGEGTIDGQADCKNWWPWKGKTGCGGPNQGGEQSEARKALFEMAEQGVPVSARVFGEGHYLRPQFIQPYRSNNVLIEGVTIKNSPMWQLHPVLCTNVTIRNVRIESSGPNNDGCDPESCKNVLIDNCYFDTGDDCIAIKSGRNADGRRLRTPSENIVIRGCTMKDGHGGVTVGSEISGGVKNVFVHDCRMDSPHLERALRFKNNAMRGGQIEDVYARQIEVGQVSDAIVSIDFNYEEGAAGGYTPIVRNVGVSNVKSKRSKYALYLRGLEHAPITGIALENCVFDNVAQTNVVEHVEGLSLRNVRINGELANERKVVGRKSARRGYQRGGLASVRKVTA
jgi:polygalacturonase